MDNSTIYIFTECGAQIGYGHVTRCISLYDELTGQGANPIFIINGDNEASVSEVLQHRKYILSNWYDNPWEDLSADPNNRPYAIVDSYIAELSAYRKISAGVVQKYGIPKAVYIDDTNRLDYPEGIIVNPSLFGNRLNYVQRKSKVYLLGSQYVILRKEFQEVIEGRIAVCERHSKKIKNILVTMGGSDIRNITPPIINVLNESIYKDCTQHVIIGKGFNNEEDIRAVCRGNAVFYYNLNAENMRDLMLKCDIAISAAGQTVYELIITKLPFVCIKIVDNQEYNIKGLLAHNVIREYIDCEESIDSEIQEKLERIPDLFSECMQEKIKWPLLGNGAKNITDILVN